MLREALGATVDLVLGLLAPLRCPVCGVELDRRGRCADCDLPSPTRVVRQLRSDRRGEFLILAGGHFEGPVRHTVHALKYRQDPVALRLLAGQAGLALPDGLGWDALVPVPAHPVRTRERGWEPVRELAQRVGRYRGLRVVHALERSRYTVALAGHSRWERRRIVRGAFRARPVAGSLLVVDDVGTSGATFHGCRQALLEAGACSVDLLVAALTPARLR